MAATGKGKPLPEINVVPLVDVCLVLLIIFMVITPMLQQGKQVSLPKADNAIEKDERNSTDIVVTIEESGALWLIDDPQGGTKPYQVSESELKTAVTTILAREPYRPVLIKADKDLEYGEVKKIMLACKNSGAHAVNLAAEAEKKKKDADTETAAGELTEIQAWRLADGRSR